jgi:hypothetical protein
MTPRQTLIDYCRAHLCKTCPMNTPGLGVLTDGDECVVSMAIGQLPQDEVES